MELRLLLAFILMGVVLFVTPYFYKTVAPLGKRTAPVAAMSAPAPPSATAAPAETAAATDSETAAPPVTAQREETRTVDTDLFRIVFCNRGGVVRSWRLKKYLGQQLVNAASHADPPLALYFPARRPAVDVNQALYEMHTNADGLAIGFDYSNGKVVVRKSVRFRKSSYLLDIATEVTEGGRPLPHQIEWRGGFGDMAVKNPAGDQQTLCFDVTAAKLVRSGARAARDGPVTLTGKYSFAGVGDQYFLAAFLPERGASVALTTFSDDEATVRDTREQPFAGVAVGDGPANHFSLYLGPKDVDILRAADPKLEQVIGSSLWATGVLSLGAVGFFVAALLARRGNGAPNDGGAAGAKRRHGCLTAWLVVAGFGASLGLVSFLLGPMWAPAGLPGGVLAAVGYAGDIVSVIALFRWRKWGFFGFLGSLLLGTVAPYLVAPSYRPALVSYRSIPLSAAGYACQVALVCWVLQIGKEKKAWTRLE